MIRARFVARGRVAVTLFGFVLFLSACGRSTPTPNVSAGRIVSLVPVATETLFALGAGPRVAARSRYCDWPPAVLELPVAGDALGVSPEVVAIYRPGLVIIAGRTQEEALRPLEGRMRIETVLPESVEELLTAIARLAALTGTEAKGAELVEKISHSLAVARGRAQGRERRRVLLVVQHEPLIVAGAGSFVGEILEAVGAENIAGDLHRPWPSLSLETMVARDPEVIIDAGVESDATAANTFWARFDTLSAVRAGRVRRLEDISLLRPGPRLPQLVDSIEALLDDEGR